jgi:cytochrome c-type biogenesis protein CcmH/NrfG
MDPAIYPFIFEVNRFMSLISATVVDSLFNAIPYSQSQYDTLSNSALSRGIDLYTNGDYDRAVKDFRRAIALSPSSENAKKSYDFMARAYLLDGNTDAAIKAYKEAIRVFPNEDTLRVSLGDIYYKEGLLTEAEAEYTAAIKLNPDSPESRYGLGQVYFDSKRYEEAEAQFKKVVSLSPSSTIGYYGLGQTYRKTGDYNDAITQLEKATTLDRSFYNGLLELGYTYADMGDVDNANGMVEYLSDQGSSLWSNLSAYIYETTSPEFLAAYSTNGFNDSLGPGTPVSDLDSNLSTPQAEKTFTMRFSFTKDMDPVSVQNPFNWKISRATGVNVGGAYNYCRSIPSTETSIGAIPVSVIYESDEYSADVTFKVAQNVTGDATIDPSHIVFSFYGMDAYGKAMNLTADEYSGISKIV